MSAEAVRLARGLNDPLLLAYALEATWVATWAADNVVDRLSMTIEMVQISETIGDLERLFMAHVLRIWALLESGDLAAMVAAIDVIASLAQQLRQPAQHWMVAVIRAVAAVVAGRFAAAERLIEDAFAIGERSVPWNTTVTHDLELFVLCREQGRLDDLDAGVRHAVDIYPTYLVWRCVLADLSAQLGREPEARFEFERFATNNFPSLPFEEEWLVGITLLAEVCSALGDASRAVTLHRLLEPYAGLIAVAPPEVSVGTVTRALGNLAATAGHFSQARTHFENAIAVAEQMGAHSRAAHARHDYARLLIGHDRREDRALGVRLAAQAREPTASSA